MNVLALVWMNIHRREIEGKKSLLIRHNDYLYKYFAIGLVI